MRIPLSPMDYYFFRRSLYTIQYIFEYHGRLDASAFGRNFAKAVEAFDAVGARMKFLSDREIELETGYAVPITSVELGAELAILAPGDTAALVRPVSNAPGEPLLTVQLTYTPTRTFVGFSFSHMLGDGKSTFHFLSELSSLCRGGIVVEQPSNCREYLRRGNGRYAGRAQEALFSATGYTIPKPAVAPVQVLETLRFQDAELDGLRDRYARQGVRVSRNDIVMAGLAKRFHAHIPLHEGKFIIRCPVDYRRIAGLPPGYFGNAVRDAVAAFDPGELEEMELGEVARKVREAIQAVDEDSVRRSLQCLNALREEKGFGVFEEVGCPGLIVTNWSKFPIVGIDFGLGAPLSFHHASVNPRLAIILPVAGGLEVRFKRPDQAQKKKEPFQAPSLGERGVV